MPYSSMKSLSMVKNSYKLKVKKDKLFFDIKSIEISDWLKESLKRANHSILFSEKAKSEAIIMPILLELQERNLDCLKVFSGVRLDIDESQNLNGECDFILAKDGIVDIIEKPLISIIEAKKGDIDLGLAQCSAQMVGAREYNKQEQIKIAIYGVVTNSKEWQFMKLDNDLLIIDSDTYHLKEIEKLLGVFQSIIN